MAEVKLPNEADKYPCNSIMRPAEEKRDPVESVVKGKVTQQKETLSKKFKKMFMPGDIKDAKSYVINQVLIPGFKNGVLSMIEMMFFGQVSNRFWSRGFSSSQQSQSSRTAYSYVSSTGARVNTGSAIIPRNQREMFSFQNITFENYDDAKDVVDSMIDILDRVGIVCVGDFYALCGIKTEPPDYDWGWKSFSRLEPRRLRDGYTIDMQPPLYLK